MTIGGGGVSIKLVLCIGLVFFNVQTAASKNRRFLWLSGTSSEALECYRKSKGFSEMTSPKGALARVIGLAPVHVESWNEKNRTTRYSMCVSTLQGFKNAVDSIVKTEGSGLHLNCDQGSRSIDLVDRLKNLSNDLQRTVQALEYVKADQARGHQVPEVKAFDAKMALRIANKTAQALPPNGRRKLGPEDAQSLVSLVILQQLQSTARDLTQYNVCPVSFLR